MIEAEVAQAIAVVTRRVVGANPELLGTAFVVGDGLLLTALHVVDGKADLFLTFPPAVPMAATVKARSSSASLDWALLECAGAKGRAPIRLRPLPFGPDAMWETFGYAAPSGVYLGGRILSAQPGKRIVLRSDEILHAATGEHSAGGASGSPVIAHGVAVGIVVTEPTPAMGGFLRKGQLEAEPIGMVHGDPAATPHLTLDDEWLPYQEKFAGSLSEAKAQPGVKKLASRFNVPHDATEVARALLKLGWVEIRNSLRSLSISPEDKQVLSDLAESLWVDQAAAQKLLAAIKAREAAALNVAHRDTATYYIDRADAIETAQEITWKDRLIPVTHVDLEVDSGTLLDTVRRLLQTPTRKTDAQIKNYLAGNHPVIVLLQIGIPITAELIDELRELEQELAGVCPIVMTGPVLGTPPDPPRRILVVSPVVPAAFEDELRQRYADIKGT